MQALASLTNGRDSLFDRSYGEIDLFKACAQWQHQNDDVADRSRQKLVAASRKTDLSADLVGCIEGGSISTPNLDSDYKTGSPDLPHVWPLLKPVKPHAKISNLWLETFKNMFSFEDIEICERRGASQWIPAVAVPVVESLLRSAEKRGEDPVGRQSRRQWKIAARQSFRDCHEIREHIFVLAGKKLAGSPEPGHDFVENQEDFVFIAPSAQGLKRARRPEPHSCGALNHWLND